MAKTETKKKDKAPPTTEVVNLDRTRYQVLTNDKNIIKILTNEYNAVVCGTMKRPKQSIFDARRNSNEYEALSIYVVTKEQAEELRDKYEVKFEYIPEKRIRRKKAKK